MLVLMGGVRRFGRILAVLAVLAAPGCGVVLGSNGEAENARRDLAPREEVPDADNPLRGGVATSQPKLDENGNPIEETTTTFPSTTTTLPLETTTSAAGGTGPGGSTGGTGPGGTQVGTNGGATGGPSGSGTTADPVEPSSDLCKAAVELGLVGASLNVDPESSGWRSSQGIPDSSVRRVLSTFSRVLVLLPPDLATRFTGLITLHGDLTKALDGESAQEAATILREKLLPYRGEIVELLTAVGAGCPSSFNLVPKA